MEGPAGDRCLGAACAPRSYHFIPLAYTGRADADDVMIGKVVADFLVVGVLGSGGFGNVHHVLQLPLRTRPIQGALKRIRPAAADPIEEKTLRARFESEADALASLSHPNIVRLLKSGIDGDVPYLVLELVTDAETLERELEEHMRQGVGMPAPDVVAITEQILNALEAAHSQGIVHRDVKPGNVMLQRVVGYDVFVRMLDFGSPSSSPRARDAAGHGHPRLHGARAAARPRHRPVDRPLRAGAPGPDDAHRALRLLGRPRRAREREAGSGLRPGAARAGGARSAGRSGGLLRRATAYDRNQRYASAGAFRRAPQSAFARPNREGGRKPGQTRDLAPAPTPVPSPRPRSEPPEARPTEILAEPPWSPRPVAPSTAAPAPAPVEPERPAPSAPPWPSPSSSRAATPDPTVARWPLLAAVQKARHLPKLELPPAPCARRLRPRRSHPRRWRPAARSGWCRRGGPSWCRRCRRCAAAGASP
ncbi:MAG: protein kinase [Myxococcota bacterium]